MSLEKQAIQNCLEPNVLTLKTSGNIFNSSVVRNNGSIFIRKETHEIV